MKEKKFIVQWAIGFLIMMGGYSFIKLTNKEEDFDVLYSSLLFLVISLVIALQLRRFNSGV